MFHRPHIQNISQILSTSHHLYHPTVTKPPPSLTWTTAVWPPDWFPCLYSCSSQTGFHLALEWAFKNCKSDDIMSCHPQTRPSSPSALRTLLHLTTVEPTDLLYRAYPGLTAFAPHDCFPLEFSHCTSSWGCLFITLQMPTPIFPALRASRSLTKAALPPPWHHPLWNYPIRFAP